MKVQTLLTAVCLFSGALLNADSLFYEHGKPDRKVELGKKAELNLTAANTVVVTAPDASDTVQFAAEELSKYLGQTLGGSIPVVHQPNPDKISLIVGLNEWSDQAGVDRKTLIRDAFIIRTRGSQVFIAGIDDPKAEPEKMLKIRGISARDLFKERATLFAVYDFLERFAGTRFYHAGELFTIIQPEKAIALPAIDIYDRPDYMARFYSYDSGVLEDDDLSQKCWSPTVHHSPSKMLDYFRNREQTRNIPNCHGLSYLRYIERFSKTHPEYFALHSSGKRYFDRSMPHTGQLCYTSGIMEEIYKDAEAILSGDREKLKARDPHFINQWGNFSIPPNAQMFGMVFNFMPQDSYYPCRCKNCEPYMKTPQSISNFMWGKIVEIANRLKKNGVKGYVSAMAYPPCHIPPENLEFPDNLVVMVAQNGPWDPPAVQAENHKIIREWNKRSKVCKVWMWNYICKVECRRLVMPGIPPTTPRAVGKYYASLAGDINGAFLESGSTGLQEHFMQLFLDRYIHGKICWNNSLDTESILKEHYQLCYGKAAPEMQKIFERMEDLWLHKIGGNTIMNNLGPMNIPPSDYELWHDIYSGKCLKEMRAWYDSAERKAGGDKKALERIRYIRKVLFNPIEQQRENYMRITESISGFKVAFGPGTPAELWLQPLKNTDQPFTATKVKAEDLGSQLKITFFCDEPEMDKVSAAKRQFDESGIWQDNSVEIFLNPSADNKNYYHWIINSAGSWFDAKAVKNGAKQQIDAQWNSNAEVKVGRNAKGWTAELILDKSIAKDWNPDGFKANFTRSRILAGKQQLFTWSPFLVSGFHELEKFGSLVPPEKIPVNQINMKELFASVKYNNRDKAGSLDASTFVFSGKSLKITASDKSEIPAGKYRGYSLGIRLDNIRPNTKYRLTYYIKVKDMTALQRSGGAGVQIWNTNRNFWFPQPRLTGTTPWIKQCFVFTSVPESNPKSSYLHCHIMNAYGEVWFDGVTLEEIK